MPPIQDHPLRYQLANELHARPFPTVKAPATAAFLAVKRLDSAAARDRNADLEHLLELLDRYGAAHPQPDASHYSGDLGRHHLKWESHTEFVTYTAFRDGVSDRPFDPTDFEVFPDAWLDTLPGHRVTSALIRSTRPRMMPSFMRMSQIISSRKSPATLAVSSSTRATATLSETK